MRRLIVLCLALGIVVPVARIAHAGQVFVNVGPFTSFAPKNASALTPSDHVIWTWVGSGHTVTQGPCGSGLGGIFNSDPSGSSLHNAGTFFSWKIDQIGSTSYYCRPHCLAMGMTGTVNAPVGGNQEADFRITEVRYDGVGSNFVEVTNLGDAAADLNGFRLSINGNSPLLPWSAGTTVASGASVVVNNPTGLATTGSVALYVPMNVVGGTGASTALTDTSMIIDYVEWGTVGGQLLESTASAVNAPKLWTAGDFAPQVATTHDISFCGARGEYGVNVWTPVLTPTPGTWPNNCASPSLRSSWGRLKTLYR